MELFETKIRYEKTMEDGQVKKTSEAYLIDAVSFAEAEARIVEKMTPYIIGEFTVSAVKRNVVSEVFPGDGDRWYAAKVAYIMIDEKSGMEKRSTSNIYVQADNFDKAYKALLEGMKDTLSDWEIQSLSETAILEIFITDGKKEED